ncbi:MAG: hypothetical protein ABI678_17755 [Kofleriaceae bacterium]
MRPALLVVILFASSPGWTAPSVATDKAVNAKLEEVGNPQGRLWSETVPKVVGILGQPNLATKDQLDWILVSDQACYQFMLISDGEFVKSATYDSTGNEVSTFAACKAKANSHAKVPPLPPVRVVDLAGPAKLAMTQWGAGEFQALFDAAHPEFQKSVGKASALKKAADQVTAKAGKFVKLDKPTQAAKGFGWFLTGTAVFEHKSVAIKLGFRLVDGQLRLAALDFPSP